MIMQLLSRIMRKASCYIQYCENERKLKKIQAKGKLRIMNADQTIRAVKRNKMSIARFGDGEFNLVFNHQGINFQNANTALSTRLTEVLVSNDERVLVCIPFAINSTHGLNEHARNFYIQWGLGNYQRLMSFVKQYGLAKKVFGDTNLSRPYKDWKSESHARKCFPHIQEWWKNENILIVEGSQTRFSVGNDLLENAASVKRILAPAENAFDQYEDIKNCILEHYTGELVLLALGPTATVLAYDLAKCGVWALDIGHLDIEYEWFQRKATSKIAIPGKYTNEAFEGNRVEDCGDTQYIQEIVAKVGVK